MTVKLFFRPTHYFFSKGKGVLILLLADGPRDAGVSREYSKATESPRLSYRIWNLFTRIL